MTFIVTGIDKFGKKLKTKIEAIDEDELKSILLSKEIIYRSIKELKSKEFQLFGTKKISYVELANFSKSLSIYLMSGISLVEAIRLSLNLYEDNKLMNNFLQNILSSLEDGNNIYEAMQSQQVLLLPQFFLESIKVSSDTGVLPDVLAELSVYLKKQHRISKDIANAFAYPKFLLVVAILMVVFMLNFLVPKITSLFEQNSQELPPLTIIVISISDFLKHNWLFILISIVIISLTIRVSLKVSAKFRYQYDYFILKLPLIGQIVKFNILARFSYIVSTLIRSGVNFIHALSLAKGVMGNKFLEKVIEDSLEKVVAGAKFSSSLSGYKKDLDKTFVQSLVLGEESGNIDEILHNTSELYFEQNQDRIKMFLSLLEPFLMLSVGLSVGLIVIAMMLPIFSLSLG